MANLNINPDIKDQFYRYKMPRLIAKVEGKGNGIKTVIANMADVAKALHRPPTYTTKYFGCELGAQTLLDQKNDRFIVNGAHDAAKLQDLLFGFIKRFVLCPECDNPETDLAVSVKKGMIAQRCIACGHQANVDMRHKLTTYILKNPPGSECKQDPGSSTTTPSKASKGGKKGKKGKEEAVNGDANGTHDSPPEDDGFGDDDDDWGEDTSDAAVQQRMEALSSAAKNLAVSDDLEKTPQERMNILFKLIKGKKEAGTLAGGDKEVLAEAERLDIKDKAPLVLVELLFDENILSQIKTYRTYFLRVCRENPKAQKYLLGGLEQLIGNVHKEVLMPKVPHILKAFYDTDILDEEVLIDWDKKVSKKYVGKEVAKEMHDKARPFIKWLEEAEEETSDEEEELEVVYSHTGKVGTETIRDEKAEKEKEEEDDFDIDAI